MLDKFKFTDNNDGTITVESKISGNKLIVTPPKPFDNNSMHALLYTLLNDLKDDGVFG